eukprot:TRINITY_DN8379_c0_g1_i1.p1 TRINITY_DN8379_c0_g1~~TRINITY_DN8379_c0_g1_i1.p1  ORF type:complete len:285 (+),score=38.22 TRINITY_DN8379_c0_g1_i1:85-939(+)
MSDACVRQRCNEYAEIYKRSDWVNLQHDASETAAIRYCCPEASRCWIEVVCESDISLDFYSLARRPEFLCSYPELQDALFKYEMLDHLGPGDAVLRMGFTASNPQHETSASIIFGSSGSGWQEVRTSHFIDFPSPGQWTSVIIPVGEKGIYLANALAHNVFITSEQGSSKESVRISCVFSCPWDSYPSWATPMGVAWCNFVQQKALVLKREQPRLQSLAVAFYVILALRSCSRGPPLLPLVDSTQNSSPERIGGYFWKPDDREHFHFYAKTCTQDPGRLDANVR